VSSAEDTWLQSPGRRQALTQFARLMAASPLAGPGPTPQLDPRPLSEHRRLPGLDEMADAFDFEPLFYANVPQAVYDYTAHGDGSEFTLRRNRQVFEWVDLVPGSAVEPAMVDLSTNILGLAMKFPILIAPSATMVPVHPEGEIGMHRAATAAANTPMILSHNTSTPVERVAASASGPLWSQFYPQQDRAIGLELLNRVQDAGCTGVVVTIDQQASYYERTQRNRNLGGAPRAAGRGRGGSAPASGPARYRVTSPRLWYTWSYLDEVRPAIKGPMLVKGVLTPDDALTAIEHGADGIIVSNHGGRSLDYAPSTLEVLPNIVAAVRRRVPVLIDSGFRRGTDILKALALGADAVMLGRASRWALGAFGAPGVQRMLEMLQKELQTAVAGTGRTTRASIDASIVRTQFP
jgi:4-hydroxymandelate oxidase